MSKLQKIILTTGLSLVALIVLFPPWIASGYSQLSGSYTWITNFGFLLNNSFESVIYIPGLLIRLLLVAVLTTVAFLISKKREEK